MWNGPGRYALTAELISVRAFKDYLKHREQSYDLVARKVTLLGTRVKPTPVRCSKALIGHLATGEVKGTSPARAKLIEQALDAPVGSLFVYKVSRVSADTEQPLTRAGAA